MSGAEHGVTADSGHTIVLQPSLRLLPIQLIEMGRFTILMALKVGNVHGLVPMSHDA